MDQGIILYGKNIIEKIAQKERKIGFKIAVLKGKH